MNNNFCVGMSIEMVAASFEFASQLGKIVDFTVKNDPDALVFVVNGLAAAGKKPGNFKCSTQGLCERKCAYRGGDCGLGRVGSGFSRPCAHAGRARARSLDIPTRSSGLQLATRFPRLATSQPGRQAVAGSTSPLWSQRNGARPARSSFRL